MRSYFPSIIQLFSHRKLWLRSLKLVWASVPGYTSALGILLIIQGFLPGTTVYLSKLTIDSFLAAKDSRSYQDIEGAFLLFLITGISLLAADSMRYISDWVRNAQAEYFSDYIKRLMHQKSTEVDFAFYESSKYHDLMEQAGGESQSKPLALLENFGSIIQSTVTLITFGALLMSYGWPVPILLLIGALPSLMLSVSLDKRFFEWWKSNASNRRWLFYYDGMMSQSEAAAEMRLFALGNRFSSIFQELRAKLRNEKLRHLRQQFGGKIVANALALVVGVIAMGWIALRVYQGSATLGDLAVFYQVFSRGQVIVAGLLASASKTVSNSLYLESLFDYLDLEPKVVSSQEPVRFPFPIKNGIRFRNVSFRYPDSKSDAISDFDLFIPARKHVAVVGVNGAGKSTLVKLLCRFYDPDRGSIEIDGIDIRLLDLNELRRSMSVLFQFPVRFQDTAKGNIMLGGSEADQDLERMLAASKLAGAHQFIKKLPKEYETQLGRWFDDGSELSGGEWQKIALARSYYRDSEFIVLDEPTSFMDSWGEADWYSRFLKLAKDRTGLIITHRFTIAMRADIIHVLNDSRLVESGTHLELLQKNGFYAESWNAQMKIAREKQSDRITV